METIYCSRLNISRDDLFSGAANWVRRDSHRFSVAGEVPKAVKLILKVLAFLFFADMADAEKITDPIF